MLRQAYEIAMNDGYYPSKIDNSTETSAKYGKILQEKDVEILVKSITCKPGDFDKTYDTLIQEYLDIGGQEVIDEKRAIYSGQKQK